MTNIATIGQDALQFLLDKHAIEQVYTRYCEIVDAKSFDSLHEVFTPDSKGDYNFFGGHHSTSPDLAALIEAMKANLGPDSCCGPTQHNVGNFRVQVDGNTAKAKVQYYAEHLGTHDYEGQLYSMWGQYADDLVRTAQGWRVKNRVYTGTLTQGPVVTVPRSQS